MAHLLPGYVPPSPVRFSRPPPRIVPRGTIGETAAQEPAKPSIPATPPRDWSALLETYVTDVLAGNIPAGKWLRLACERHRRDIVRSTEDGTWPYTFDWARASRVCRFAEMLPHVKGKWARATPAGWAPRIKLEPWQVFIVASLFGWVWRTNGRRRFRHASIYVARKNGKSTLAAAIGLWMFGKDGEPGAEVYSGATSMKQAKEVFTPAWQMCKKCPPMVEGLGITITASKLLRLIDASVFEPVIGKPGDGASPHCALVDEYHEHGTSELHDTMVTGMGAREQPLLLIISTAGSNLAGPCREDWKACESLLKDSSAGTDVDETQFAVIFAADQEDDWTTEEAARKANPNYEVSVSKEYLDAQVTSAIAQARKQAAVKTKHLNLWVTAKNGYFDVQKLSAPPVAAPALKLADFAGRPCFLGLDASAKRDICAKIRLFPDADGSTFTLFGQYYLPRATVDLPQNQHYRSWEASGWLTVTEGNENDFGLYEAGVVEDSKTFAVREVCYDPWQLIAMIQRLRQTNGLQCVEVPKTVKSFSDPMKTVDAMIASGRIRHSGDPVFVWAMGNVVAKVDHNDNVFPNKEQEAQKIDPAVALLMAMCRALAQPQAVSSAGFLLV